MTSAVRINLPTELADFLIDEGEAVRPMTTRGGASSQAFSLFVDSVNTGSSMVTVGLATATFAKLAKRLTTVGRKSQAVGPVDVTVTGPLARVVVKLDPDVSSAEAGKLLLAALAAAGGPSPQSEQ